MNLFHSTQRCEISFFTVQINSAVTFMHKLYTYMTVTVVITFKLLIVIFEFYDWYMFIQALQVKKVRPVDFALIHPTRLPVIYSKIQDYQ